MNRNEIIGEIADLYDEIERLNNELEVMKLKYELEKAERPPHADSENERHHRYFIDKLYEDSIRSWHKVEVSRNENGDLQCETYDRWVKNIWNQAPHEFSEDEAKMLLEDKFHEEYESQKSKMLKKFLEEENGNEEEE